MKIGKWRLLEDSEEHITYPAFEVMVDFQTRAFEYVRTLKKKF